MMKWYVVTGYSLEKSTTFQCPSWGSHLNILFRILWGFFGDSLGILWGFFGDWWLHRWVDPHNCGHWIHFIEKYHVRCHCGSCTGSPSIPVISSQTVSISYNLINIPHQPGISSDFTSSAIYLNGPCLFSHFSLKSPALPLACHSLNLVNSSQFTDYFGFSYSEFSNLFTKILTDCFR